MQTQITFRCEDKNFLGTAILDAKGARSFSCQVCGLKLFFNQATLELGSHGHTKASLKHTLLQTQEVGVEK